jgi:hypothetical protein
VILHRNGGGTDQRQRLGRGDLRSAGEVDCTDDRPTVGVVHRHRGATPWLNDPREVFGLADLQLDVERERCARSIGSCATFAPIGAGHEVHRLCLAACVLIALDPQQGAVGGRHRDDDTGVGSVVYQEPADYRERLCERMTLAHSRQLNRRGLRTAEVRVYSASEATHPALRHYRS